MGRTLSISKVARNMTVLLLGLAVAAGVFATPQRAHADVNDFVIQSFDADFTLTRDNEGRSALHTIEQIVAIFPEHDQNRGLIREIPQFYDGHSTNVEVMSVTDAGGSPRDYEIEGAGDSIEVIIAVPEGEYVHGEQHYVIEYTQRDVTRMFDDTGVDEFYWDVNGTDWQQPLENISATINIAPELQAAATGAQYCYRGGFGETTPCVIEGDARAGEPLTINEQSFSPEQNVSFAIAFAANTFAPAPTPPVSFWERTGVLLWAGAASLIAAISTIIVSLVRDRRPNTGRAIIAQYDPPKNVSVALSAVMLNATKKQMTATLLDFAVRGNLRLLRDIETNRYGLRAKNQDGLLEGEQKTYSRLFTGSPAPTKVDAGTTYWFSKESTRLGDLAASLKTSALQEARTRGLLKSRATKDFAIATMLLVAPLALTFLHALLIDNSFLIALVFGLGLTVLLWTLVGVYTLLISRNRPTYEGALLLEHLEGLREYIRLAEADRIRMLQSASGAEVDEQFIVHVYERLLPYAVLFGFEKEWQSTLDHYYRESSPDWLDGAKGSSFGDVLVLSSFGRAVRHSPKTSTSTGSMYSSSGGSSGGGFSGGGGGGGGGRGI